MDNGWHGNLASTICLNRPNLKLFVTALLLAALGTASAVGGSGLYLRSGHAHHLVSNAICLLFKGIIGLLDNELCLDGAGEGRCRARE